MLWCFTYLWWDLVIGIVGWGVFWVLGLTGSYTENYKRQLQFLSSNSLRLFFSLGSPNEDLFVVISGPHCSWCFSTIFSMVERITMTILILIVFFWCFGNFFRFYFLWKCSNVSQFYRSNCGCLNGIEMSHSGRMNFRPWNIVEWKSHFPILERLY